MPNATITVKSVNQPREGKKFGYLGTSIGNVGAKQSDLSQFSPGQTYEIEYSLNGEYKNFVKIVSGAPAPAGHNKPNGNGDAKSREMFIMGVVGRAMGSGKFGFDDIGLLTARAASAWDDHGAKKDDGAPY